MSYKKMDNNFAFTDLSWADSMEHTVWFNPLLIRSAMKDFKKKAEEGKA